MKFADVPLRRVVRMVNGGTPTSEAENWGGDIAWATPVDVGQNHGDELHATARTITEEGLRSGSAMVPAGSVLVSSRAPLGYVAQAKVPIAFNQGCKGLIPLDRVTSRFLSYALQHIRPAMAAAATGTTFQEISGGALASLTIPLPDIAEQRTIVDFLDRETAQIDAMVDAQERLIALLEERRRAALLNGTLGRTDFIWEGRLGRALRPLSRVPHTDAEVVTAYRDGAVLRRSERRDDGYTFSNLEQGYQGVEVGDFVFHGLDGFAGAVGVAASSGKCSPVYHVATATELANNRYLAYLLRSLGLSGYLEANAWSVRQRSVDYRNWKQLAALWVQLPALEAQLHLVRELEQQLGRIEAMIAKAQESIALMKERRAAVISAAVTGRIDVRTGIEQVERDLEEARE